MRFVSRFFVLVALSTANLIRLIYVTTEHPWLVERFAFGVGLGVWIGVTLWLTMNEKIPSSR